jgi:hypothetical protein
LEFFKQIERDTGQTPPALAKRPLPDEWSFKYWRMYQETQGSRQYTFGGPAEIPYPVKILWLNENHVYDPDERDDFLNVVSQLDNAYIEHSAKKADKK